MEKTDPISRWFNYGKLIKALITFLASVALFITFHWVLDKIGRANATNFAFAFTIWFMIGIYCGRYLSYLWVNTSKYIQNALLILLPVILFLTILLTNVIVNKIIVSTFEDSHYGPNKMLLLFIVFFVMSVTLGALIKLIRRKIQDQIKAAETNAAHSQSELQLLQSQLSPHFLFNTLNNLYGISLNHHEILPPLLLRLSELLRYSVYDAKKLFVPLQEELNYLKNYIEFEKIRIGDRLELKADLEEIRDNSIKIAPMLLIVFVENAFKHSKNTLAAHINVDISLQVIGSSVLFSIKNSFQKEEVTGPQQDGGLGLENVKKRLELIYKDEYDLKMEANDGVFSVILRIKAKYGEQSKLPDSR